MKYSEKRIAEGILLTDQYQLTMTQLYFRLGLHEKQAHSLSAPDASSPRNNKRCVSYGIMAQEGAARNRSAGTGAL